MSVSLEKYVLDNEIAQMVRESLKGIPVTQETLDLNTILKVGVADNYLSEPTTLNNLNAFWMPKLLNRDWRKEWEDKGWKKLFKICCERVDEILATFEPQPLDRDINRELEAILKKADKELITTTIY